MKRLRLKVSDLEAQNDRMRSVVRPSTPKCRKGWPILAAHVESWDDFSNNEPPRILTFGEPLGEPRKALRGGFQKSIFQDYSRNQGTFRSKVDRWLQ